MAARTFEEHQYFNGQATRQDWQCAFLNSCPTCTCQTIFTCYFSISKILQYNSDSLLFVDRIVISSHLKYNLSHLRTKLIFPVDVMSSNARSRGQARGQPANQSNQPHRGNAARGRVIPSFDGPASRGSGSAAGSQSQVSAPAGGSRRASNAGANPSSQVPAATSSQVAIPAARDPAREGPAPRATDVIKNVDMPASFYNIDNQVSTLTASINIHTNIS